MPPLPAESSHSALRRAFTAYARVMDITFRTAGLAAAAGAGLALAIGCGIAHAEADSPGQASSSTATHAQSKRVAAGPKAMSSRAQAADRADRAPRVRGGVPMTSRLRTAALQSPAPDAGAPEAPDPFVPLPAHTDVGDIPSPDDMTPTAYGDIGNWMLQPNGQIADWIGHSYEGKTLLEGINVIIVDPAQVPLDMAVRRLNRAMVMAGFPAVIHHSGGYQGLINGVTFQQQPKGDQLAFSDAFFLLPNNHGRIMGPFPPADGNGYIWIASLSREELGKYEGELTHVFVSFNEARDALAEGLVERAGATNLGPVFLDNAYDTDLYTTGDADGYAVVIQLPV